MGGLGWGGWEGDHITVKHARLTNKVSIEHALKCLKFNGGGGRVEGLQLTACISCYLVNIA